MAPTPVRHVRVPDVLWDAARAKAESEFRTVADVIVECLRNYAGTLAPKAPVDLSVPVIPDLSDAEVDGFLEAVSEGRSPAVGTPGVVATAAPRKRKSRAKVTTAAELAKPPEEREDVTPPGIDLTPPLPVKPYPCCKHCKTPHGGHGVPCLNGCHG